MYHLYDQFNLLLYLSFVAFINEKITKAPDDRSSIKRLYLNSMRLFEYDPRVKEKRWVEKSSARENHLVSGLRKQVYETGNGDPTFKVEPLGADSVGHAYQMVESTAKNAVQHVRREGGRE